MIINDTELITLTSNLNNIFEDLDNVIKQVGTGKDYKIIFIFALSIPNYMCSNIILLIEK